MALANVAWVLASQGKRVLVIDWDLEAPGQHRYFKPFLIDPDLTDTPGLIDFVWDFSTTVLTDENTTPAKDTAWIDAAADLSDYMVRLNWPLASDPPFTGHIDFVPSGRQGTIYAERVNAFNWDDFYQRLGGGALLDAVRHQIKQDYDYILIDSRTGVSDTAGICTVHLPDALVVLFTLNNQSIYGAVAVAESVQAQRKPAEDADAKAQPPFPIYPVPTRIDNSEKEKLEARLNLARAQAGPFLGFLDESAQQRYWREIEFPYVPFYSYEEVLAVFGDDPSRSKTLLGAVEFLTSQLTNGQVRQLNPFGWQDREALQRIYAGEPPLPQAEETILSKPTEPIDLGQTGTWKTNTHTGPLGNNTIREQDYSLPSKSQWWSWLSSTYGILAISILMGLLYTAYSTWTADDPGSTLTPEVMRQGLFDAKTPDSLRLVYLHTLYTNGERDFKALDLTALDLRNLTLTGIDLQSAKLDGANLAGAVLDSANLSGTTLGGTRFVSTNLRWAQFNGATVDTTTSFEGANLYAARNLTERQVADARTNAVTILQDSSNGPFTWMNDLDLSAGNTDTQYPDAPLGWIWIGDYDAKQERWSRIQLQLSTGETVTAPPRLLKVGVPYQVTANVSIRAGQPANDRDYFRGQDKIGVALRGTTVLLQAPPVAIDREYAVQYWARVRADTTPRRPTELQQQQTLSLLR